MGKPELDIVVRESFTLGEGILWNTRSSTLWWTDVRGPAIHSFDPASFARQHHAFDCPVASFAFRADGTLLVGAMNGFHIFDPRTRALILVAAPEAHLPSNRCNDGKTDRDGRFWCGTMEDFGRTRTGALYRMDADRSLHKLRDGIEVPNSLAFAPDGRTMYFTDTRDGCIFAYDYDRATGTPSNERLLASADCAPGRPDGSTVDADGCLWSTRFGGACVVRITPKGRVDRVIDVPATNVTCCTFGGPGLDTLFITTATIRMTPEERAAQPLAGFVFAVRPGVTGVPEADFAG